MAKPGNLPKSNALLEIGEHWIEKYFHFFFPIDRLKNKSDVHNLLPSASQKTHCAYVVLAEIIIVYFQNYAKKNSRSRV